jgi:SAM-dependent methyltransferase
MSGPRPAMDWGLGHYERTAEQLLPAAEALVDAAAPREGERVVDLGCGTGNVALLAAERGARVTGIDPAERLLEVAAERAREAGLDVAFLPGEASSIPLEDGAADLLVSVFGVIFASDPEAAAAEMARVITPGGRIVISAWIPGGPISEAMRVGREAVDRALGTPPGPPPFAWHEQGELEDLLSPHGFTLDLEEREIAFTATSPQQYVADEVRDHPLRVAAAAALGPEETEAVNRRTVEIFEAANEEPAAFRVTSRYVIGTARRGS